jgi:hypothetical protein
MQINEQLRKQIEVLGQGNVLEKLHQMEKEKNALLDYIEESLDKSHQNSARSHQDSDRLK